MPVFLLCMGPGEVGIGIQDVQQIDHLSIFWDFKVLLGASFTLHAAVQSESGRPMRGARTFSLEKGRLSLQIWEGMPCG